VSFERDLSFLMTAFRSCASAGSHAPEDVDYVEYLGKVIALSPLLHFLNRYTRITVDLDLTGISVINGFIRVDHSATFIRMNRRDADLDIAGGVRTCTVTLDTPRNDADLVLLRHLRHRYLELPS
jgi:hypothetical protein